LRRCCKSQKSSECSVLKNERMCLNSRRWRPLVEAKGVTVTQLDSIDPTLVVYRAEAVFVGVGIWDLISVISSPGATIYWDKGFESANLIEDVSELSQLWHQKTRAAWPVK
jgi:hypothetical protein